MMKTAKLALLTAALFGVSACALAQSVPPCAQQANSAFAQDRVQAVYQQLGENLNLNANQKIALEKYVGVKTKAAQEHGKWHAKQANQPRETRQARLEARAEHAKIQADALERISRARAKFVGVLTAEQKQAFDAMEPRGLCGVGPRAHRGMPCAAAQHRPCQTAQQRPCPNAQQRPCGGQGAGYGPRHGGFGPGAMHPGYGPHHGGMHRAPDCMMR
ncbi:MAG: Spy/CpxP family protein refolding chaperone [Duodenibacillus sp.]